MYKNEGVIPIGVKYNEGQYLRLRKHLRHMFVANTKSNAVTVALLNVCVKS